MCYKRIYYVLSVQNICVLITPGVVVNKMAKTTTKIYERNFNKTKSINILILSVQKKINAIAYKKYNISLVKLFMNEHNEKKKTPTYEWIPRINLNALIVFRTRLWKFSISAVNWLSSRLHLPFATYRTGRTVPCACWWTECHIVSKRSKVYRYFKNMQSNAMSG